MLNIINWPLTRNAMNKQNNEKNQPHLSMLYFVEKVPNVFERN